MEVKEHERLSNFTRRHKVKEEWFYCYISDSVGSSTMSINVDRIFVNEYIKRIKENKTLQKCTFLMKVKKLYTKWKINKCFQKVLNRNCI
jgi:hypothetical protein